MNLQAELRTATGTTASRKARKEGKVPVTLYGKDFDTKSLLINRREFEALLRKEGSNAVFDVEFDGTVQKVILKDFVRASLTDLVYNVDLEAISADQVLQVEIPLTLLNEETIKVGIVELVVNSVNVETKPDTIPSYFEIDVQGLEIGDTLQISDITVPEGVSIIDEAEQTIITVSAPTEEPEEVDPDAEVAQPEVIGAADEDEE